MNKNWGQSTYRSDTEQPPLLGKSSAYGPPAKHRLFYQSYNDTVFKEIEQQHKHQSAHGRHESDINTCRLLQERACQSNINACPQASQQQESFTHSAAKSDGSRKLRCFNLQMISRKRSQDLEQHAQKRQNIITLSEQKPGGHASDRFHVLPSHHETPVINNFDQQSSMTVIEESDLEAMFKTRFLLMKKGKKLKRTVLRWVQFMRSGKLVYFQSFADKTPQGCYSLYQTNATKVQVALTSQILKAFHQQSKQAQTLQDSVDSSSKSSVISGLSGNAAAGEGKATQMISGIQIQSSQEQTSSEAKPQEQVLFTIVISPKDQMTFKQNAFDLIFQACYHAGQGELEQFLDSKLGTPCASVNVKMVASESAPQSQESSFLDCNIRKELQQQENRPYEHPAKARDDEGLIILKPRQHLQTKQDVQYIRIEESNSQEGRKVTHNGMIHSEVPNSKKKPSIFIIKNDKFFRDSPNKPRESNPILGNRYLRLTSQENQNPSNMGDSDSYSDFEMQQQQDDNSIHLENAEGTASNISAVKPIRAIMRTGLAGSGNYSEGLQTPEQKFHFNKQIYTASQRFCRSQVKRSKPTPNQEQILTDIFNKQVMGMSQGYTFQNLKTYDNKGDLDELLNCDEDDPPEHLLNLGKKENLGQRFRGRVDEYDNDYLSHSILMENNPLDTFSKNFIEQDCVYLEQEGMINKLYSIGGVGEGLTLLNGESKQLEPTQVHQQSSLCPQVRMKTCHNEMDSNLETIKQEYTDLSITQKIQVLKQQQQVQTSNSYQSSCSVVNTQIKPYNLEQAQRITDFINQKEGDSEIDVSLNRSYSQVSDCNNRLETLIKNTMTDPKTYQQLISESGASCHLAEVLKDMSPVEALYKGIEKGWNFQFREAKQIFKIFSVDQIRSNVSDFRIGLHQIELSLFKVLIAGKKSLIDKCMAKLLHFEDSLLATKNNYKVASSNSPFEGNRTNEPHKSCYLRTDNLNNTLSQELLEMITAEAHMFKGVLRFLSGYKFKAFLIFRECWKVYRKYELVLQKLEQKDQDTLACKYAYFDDDFKSRLFLGLGLFYLGISALPKSLTTIIRIVGFTSGNRDKGLQYLQMCIDDRRSRSAYAALIQLLFKVDQEPQLDKVCTQLKALLQAYPHSAMFHWVSSIVSWKLAQLDDAVFFIERALQSCPAQLSRQAAFLKYEQGWFHYLKLEFDMSLVRFKEVLRDCLDLDLDSDELGELHNRELAEQDGLPNVELLYKDSFKESEVFNNLVKKFSSSQVQSDGPSPQKASGKGETPISRKEDFVYLPHRACLTIQLAGAYVALKREFLVRHWLNTTIALANQPGITRSKLDQEMGHLANIYLNHRKICDLLTYEIIYFLHQMPKLPNSILLMIITNISDIMRKINLNLNCQDPTQYKESPYFADYVSGMMLTIICYCFLGDSDIAALFSQRLVKAIDHLPSHYNYLVVHSLYWAGRAFLAESNPKVAETFLSKAKKFKKYEFPIDVKIEKVLADIKLKKF